MRKYLKHFFTSNRDSSSANRRTRSLQFECLSDRIPLAADLEAAVLESVPAYIESAPASVQLLPAIDGQVPPAFVSTPKDSLSATSSLTAANSLPPETLSLTPGDILVVLPRLELDPARSNSSSAQVSAAESASPLWLGGGQESFDGSYYESSNQSEDGYGGYGGYGGEVDSPPVITAFSWELIQGNYRFTGQVTDDESLSGCQIRFGGVLDGHFATIDADGGFVFEAPLPAGTTGIVSAIATDQDGFDSNEMLVLLI